MKAKTTKPQAVKQQDSKAELLDKTIDAVKQVIAAVVPFEDEARDRILKAAAICLGVR